MALQYVPDEIHVMTYASCLNCCHIFKVVIVNIKGNVSPLYILKSISIVGKISDVLLLVFHILALKLSFITQTGLTGNGECFHLKAAHEIHHGKQRHHCGILRVVGVLFSCHHCILPAFHMSTRVDVYCWQIAQSKRLLPRNIFFNFIFEHEKLTVESGCFCFLSLTQIHKSHKTIFRFVSTC